MKIKRILSALLCGIVFLSILTACSDNNSEPAKSTLDEKAELMHSFVVRAPKKTTELTATFVNTGSGKTTDVVMKKESEDNSCTVFRCEADVNLYNMVHVNFNNRA